MDDERDRTDQPDRTDHPLPGSVSDQNAEEAEPGHGGGHEPRREGSKHDGAGRKGNEGQGEKSGGEAGEGSQSTGHPDSAG
jgi:hypothetical protein